MNLREAKAAVAGLADQMIERPGGVATMELVAEFRDCYQDVITDLGVELVDDWLRRVCKEFVTKAGRGRTEQLTLPGIGKIDAFVTILDGEGDYRRKKLIYATDPDLDADRLIHQENVNGAVRALDDVDNRNRMIQPVMRAQGFPTAGPAIDWLNQQTGGTP